MGTSLGFHIVFAVLGVGMPLLMATAEGIGLWRRDAAWIALAAFACVMFNYFGVNTLLTGKHSYAGL